MGTCAHSRADIYYKSCSALRRLEKSSFRECAKLPTGLSLTATISIEEHFDVYYSSFRSCPGATFVSLRAAVLASVHRPHVALHQRHQVRVRPGLRRSHMLRRSERIRFGWLAALTLGASALLGTAPAKAQAQPQNEPEPS